MNLSFWKNICDNDNVEYSLSLESLESLDDYSREFYEHLIYMAKIYAIIDHSVKDGEILIESRHTKSAFEDICGHTNTNPDS